MRLFAAILIASLTVVPSSAWATPQSALLARMSVASGGPYTAQIESSWTTNDGSAAGIVTTNSQGDAFLSRRCLGALCTGRYFDGTTLFVVDSNDDLLPLTSADLEDLHDLRWALSLMFLAPDFRRNAGTITLKPPFHQAGKDRDIMQLAMPDGRKLSIWVNPKTALVTRIDLDLRSIRLREYRRVGPYMIPFQEIYARARPRTFLSRTVISGNLHAPIGIVSAVHRDAPAARRVRGSTLPIFPCQLANVATRCLVDTGNSGMAISLRLAEQLNAPVVGAGTAHGLGTYSTEVVRSGPLTLANAQFGPARYLVLPDLSGLGFDVVVGNAIFSSLTATLDSQSLRFGTPPKSNAQAIAVSFPALLPELSVGIDNQKADVDLDTGDDAGFDFSATFVKKFPRLFTPTTSMRVKGIGGTAVTQRGDDRVLHLGTCTILAFPTQFTAAMPSSTDGRIGARILHSMTLRFNYPAGRIEFSPAGKTPPCTRSSP